MAGERSGFRCARGERGGGTLSGGRRLVAAGGMWMLAWALSHAYPAGTRALAEEPIPAPAPTPEAEPARRAQLIELLIREAEHWLYLTEIPDHLDHLEHALGEIEALDPDNPYVHWGRARVAFWRKERFYLQETPENRRALDEKKLGLAEECHRHADRCMDIAPKNAECRLMKGVCYSMQASTWGKSWKSVRILRPMDDEFRKAAELPSDFPHRKTVTTRQLSLILRGILYRIMPTSVWFRLIAGIRGDREKSYRWMTEGVADFLWREPVVVVEFGAAALCYGLREKKPEKVDEGLSVLREGRKLPSRYPLDDLDKGHMATLIETPSKACSFRRERYEEIDEAGLKKELEESK